MKGKPISINESDLLEMHAKYSGGLTLSQVGQEIGISQQSLSVLFHKRGLKVRARMELRTRKTIGETVDDSELVKFKDKWDMLESTVKGTIAENYVKNKLSELGFDVWEPVSQNHRTDMIIMCRKKIIRIQVKCATYDVARKRFRANLSRHRRSGDYSPYRVEDVDFFLVYCAGLPSMEFYVVPAELAKQLSINLLPHREKFLKLAFSWEKFRNAFHLLSDEKD